MGGHDGPAGIEPEGADSLRDVHSPHELSSAGPPIRDRSCVYTPRDERTAAASQSSRRCDGVCFGSPPECPSVHAGLRPCRVQSPARLPFADGDCLPQCASHSVHQYRSRTASQLSVSWNRILSTRGRSVQPGPRAHTERWRERISAPRTASGSTRPRYDEDQWLGGWRRQARVPPPQAGSPRVRPGYAGRGIRTAPDRVASWFVSRPPLRRSVSELSPRW